MGSLDAVQQEQLRAIGSYLSQVRQEQARSLEDIAAKTYIPLRLLKAIEAGQDRPLPEPVFIQGFIRRYADALGLDGTDLSQKFPVHVTPLPVATTVAPSQERQTSGEVSYRSVQSAQSEDEFRSVRSSRRSGRSTNFLPYIAAAALLGLGGIALAVVRAISSRQSDTPTRSAVVLPSQPPVNASPESSAEASASSPTAASPLPTVSPQARSSPTSPNLSDASTTASSSQTPSRSASSTANGNAPVNVKLNLTDESWVQVIVDGEVKAEAVLPKGTQQSWSGKREIVVLAGNAGAVSVSHNGGAAQKMGALGDVTEKTFTAKPSASGSATSTNSTN